MAIQYRMKQSSIERIEDLYRRIDSDLKEIALLSIDLPVEYRMAYIEWTLKTYRESLYEQQKVAELEEDYEVCVAIERIIDTRLVQL